MYGQINLKRSMHLAHKEGLVNVVYCVRIYTLRQEAVIFSDLSEEGK